MCIMMALILSLKAFTTMVLMPYTFMPTKPSNVTTLEFLMTMLSTSSYNHAVINVGYDKTEGYWLIRNSWSTSWGESGHIRMARGKNTCNIEHHAWVPYL